MNFVVGDAGTGIPFIRYPQLDFSPENFFALGSPVAMFLTVRGVASLGEDFQLPTCPGFFNIFHPVGYKLGFNLCYVEGIHMLHLEIEFSFELSEEYCI